MKQLILIRHAKSRWDEFGKSDFERSLNARGERDAPEMGRRLAARLQRNGQSLDAFVCSAARRASQTARLLAPEIGFPPEAVDWRRELYLASPNAMLGVIRSLPDAVQSAALLAHNPGVTELAERLTGARIDNVPTCGVVTIAMPVECWRDAGARSELVDFDYPKRLQ